MCYAVILTSYPAKKSGKQFTEIVKELESNKVNIFPENYLTLNESDQIAVLSSLSDSVDISIFKDKNHTDIINKIDGEVINYYDFEIVLINSDYSARFKIKRDKLHELLISQYNIYSSYEPCIYPGVN